MLATATDLQKVVLSAVDIHEKRVGGRRTVVATLPTNTFLNTDIPNKANSRDFTGTKNPSVNAMINTLRTEPEMFYSKNLGIRMVATQIIANANTGKLELYFNKDEGIFNGGHTYVVLQKYGNSHAFVEVVIQEDLAKEKLVEISLALNMSKKLELTSQNEKVGAFQWIKDALPTQPIVFKEGGIGEYSVEDVLKVANIFKLGLGKSYAVRGLTESLKGISGILRTNKNQQQLSYTKYILPDMWDLFLTLRKDDVIMNNLPEAYWKNKGELSSGMTLAFLYGARVLTEINRNNIPMWKEGNNKDTALALCRRVSKEVGKLLTRSPFKDMRENGVHREPLFHAEIRNLFLEALMK
jgi:hypothetical protein